MRGDNNKHQSWYSEFNVNNANDHLLSCKQHDV